MNKLFIHTMNSLFGSLYYIKKALTRVRRGVSSRSIMPFDKKIQSKPADHRKQIISVRNKLHSGRKSGGFNTKKLPDKNATRSKKLVQAVYRKRKTDPKCSLDQDPNYTSGIVHFSYLAKSIDQTRLDGVLNWYCSHIGEQHVPRINTPKAFRFRFADIEDAMRREARLQPSLVISPHARRLFKHQQYDFICARGGRAQYKTAFLNLCEITYSNVTQTFSWIKRIYKFQDIIPDPMDFSISYLHEMEDWACEKFQTHNWWEHVTPINVSFRSKTLRFNRVMRKWARINHIEQELVNKIIKGVNECVSMK